MDEQPPLGSRLPSPSPAPSPAAPPDEAPPEIEELARDRALARLARDWTRADGLRAEIERAGWKVVDRGAQFRLERAHPPDMEVGGRPRYGSSASVPSRLSEPPSARATVVLVADRWPPDVERALVALQAHVPEGTHVVVVANAPTPEQAASLEDRHGPASEVIGDGPPEQVWTSVPVGHATALNMGIRRAAGSACILLDTSVEPLGDIVSPLVGALADPSVAVAGAYGLGSPDLRHFAERPDGEPDAISGDCLAFRRADFVVRGPLDEHFRTDLNLDVWWSFMLRDEGPDEAPRRALRIQGLELVRHPRREHAGISDGERDRLARRNLYRVIDRFGHRRDLLVDPAFPARRATSRSGRGPS